MKMNERYPSAVNHEEIERYRALAREMQGREIARLGRRLAGLPARLSARLRGDRVDLANRARYV